MDLHRIPLDQASQLEVAREFCRLFRSSLAVDIDKIRARKKILAETKIKMEAHWKNTISKTAIATRSDSKTASFD